MITEKQIQKALRNAPASGKGAIELRDHGERGAGRLVIIVKPRTGRVTAEWYAVFFRRGMRAKAKLGSYPAMTVAEARLAFLTYYAPAIRAGDVPAVVSKRRESSAGTVGELFQAYIDNLRRDGKRSANMVHSLLLSPKSGMAKAMGADRPAASIVPGDVVPHLAKNHNRGSRVQANIVRAYLSAAFAFGLKAEHDFTLADVDTRWGLKVNPIAAIPPDSGAAIGSFRQSSFACSGSGLMDSVSAAALRRPSCSKWQRGNGPRRFWESPMPDTIDRRLWFTGEKQRTVCRTRSPCPIRRPPSSTNCRPIPTAYISHIRLTRHSARGMEASRTSSPNSSRKIQESSGLLLAI